MHNQIHIIKARLRELTRLDGAQRELRIERRVYKELYRQARAIKNDRQRNRPVVINRYPDLRRLVWPARLPENVDNRTRNSYLRTVCVRYANLKGSARLTAVEQGRLAGYLCGLNGAALMNMDEQGDGTVSIFFKLFLLPP